MKLQIGKIKLGHGPVVCAVLLGDFNARTLQTLKQKGIRLVEWRLDAMPCAHAPIYFEKLKKLKRAGFSVIATIRTKKEGGIVPMPERERLEVFSFLLPKVDAVDIELESEIAPLVIQKARRLGKTSIVSFHDFKKTPPEKFLAEKIRKAKQRGADIIKIAAYARKKEDVIRLQHLLLLRSKEKESLIFISMGPLGTLSRLTFPFFGSLISYGSVTKKSAPGQLSVDELVRALR